MNNPGRTFTVMLLSLGLSGFAPLCAETIALSTPPVHINDGDTFEADLNGNGRLDFPRERLRMLYVDTPELSFSHKGKDTRFGLPARAYLAEKLRSLPITLEIDHARPYDKFGRTLALVYVRGINLNLQLIRRGHSYFDTRFAFPEDYARYARAEAEAFRKRRGIWSTRASRSTYLARLRREGKTPASPDNSLFVPGIHAAGTVNLTAHRGRFLRLRGKLLNRRPLRGGAWLLSLAGRQPEALLQVFVPSRVNRKLQVQLWPTGRLVHMDGFAQTHRGRPQLRLHHGGPQQASARKP